MNKSPNASRAILARCRRPFFGRLQLIVILFWTFVPAFRTGAIYVPDETNTPPYCWIPLETEDPEPSGGPDMGDANLNDVPDWLDAFHVATTDGTLVWWAGGSDFNGHPFVIDGVETTFAGQWHKSPDGDYDEDGIPDSLDKYPADPANNSFWWSAPNGGFPTFNGRNYRLRAQWFPGSAMDNNSNGVPDRMETTLNDLENPKTYYWQGGTFLLDGEYWTRDRLTIETSACFATATTCVFISRAMRVSSSTLNREPNNQSVPRSLVPLLNIRSHL